MKKVININFQGQVIAIEETAYEILEQYIGNLKTYFSREEGGDEIVNDIECRIAELFGNRLKHGIHCITDEDVKAIIDSIGKPQEFDSDYGEETTPERDAFAGNAPPPPDEGERQNLYRNTNDRIIGGVCSGLAHYFKTDPVWIRIIFVLFFGILFWVYIALWIILKEKDLKSNVSKRIYRNLNDRFIGGVCGGISARFRIDAWIPRVLFLLPLMLNTIGMVSFFPLSGIFTHSNGTGFNWNFNMSMVLIYVALWVLIPAARTVKQKLEMMGEEDYIRSIREKVTDNVAGSRNRAGNEGASRFTGTEGMDGMPPEPPPVPDRRTEEASRPGSGRSGCLSAFIILLKIIFFSFVGMFLLVLIAVFIGLLVTGTHLLPLKSLCIDPGYETNLLFSALGLIFLVPIAAIVTWIIRRVMKAKSRPVVGIVASLLWIAGLVLSGVLGARIADKFSVESSGERIVPITPVTSGKMYVEMQPYAEDYAEFKTTYGRIGFHGDMDNLPCTTINEDSLLFDKINLQIGKSSDSLFHVRVIAATRGRDLRAAKADIARFTYEIVQEDSLLLLPEFLSVPIEQGFRDQSITVEISVPAGKTVEMSEALREYRDNRPPAVVRKRIRKYARDTSYLPMSVD
ncbi:MAG: PspC domain-containing protein [Proteiniphilum sp.]|jgi:phage shock protein PspC (stress-responsive transcriptional regulator)|nr:PspC domain-containing protein [Proteiniphilum sp.]